MSPACKFLLFPLLAAALVLSGCAGPSFSTASSRQLSTAQVHTERSQLMRLYSTWQGVPYRYGGVSKRGVDCSALVQIFYRDVYHLSLPRQTRDQLNMGASVEQKYLELGDLVFFHTGFKTNHVGIYIGDRQFIHASTSVGVTISSLDNPYWKRHYKAARRVL